MRGCHQVKATTCASAPAFLSSLPFLPARIAEKLLRNHAWLPHLVPNLPPDIICGSQSTEPEEVRHVFLKSLYQAHVLNVAATNRWCNSPEMLPDYRAWLRAETYLRLDILISELQKRLHPFITFRVSTLFAFWYRAIVLSQ